MRYANRVVKTIPDREGEASRQYVVMWDAGQGQHERVTVEITVDFDALAGLAKRASRNTDGKAVLYFGAVKAVVRP